MKTYAVVSQQSHDGRSEGGMRARGIKRSVTQGGPRITVVTVVFNGAATLEQTIRSVIEQTYSNIEYIVVDGGSKDTTLDVVGRYQELIAISISEPDQGIYDAMNKGVKASTGDVIGILNSDDFYLNDQVLSEVAHFFAADPELEVVLGDVDFVNSDALDCPIRTYRAGNFKPWMFRFGLMPPHPAVFVRKPALVQVGLYKLGYKIAADFDLLTRLLLVQGVKYQVANRTWVRMRTGGVSTSSLKSVVTITREMKRSLQENSLYSNQLMLMCRLPFKLLTQVLRK